MGRYAVEVEGEYPPPPPWHTHTFWVIIGLFGFLATLYILYHRG